jgi:HK97 family phage prohead protease
MDKKLYKSAIQLKEDGPEGSFQAIFSTFNVIDHDRDVTLPGAFTDGQEVRISSWGHKWHDLPVGRGVIRADEVKAWVDGQFFLDTEGGAETYKTVKNLGNLQEWSYGFDILEVGFGKWEDQENIRFLRKLDVFEVSPVMLGAGIGTQTTAIKGQEEAKPYPNEHACRLRDPGDFQDDSFRRTTREHEGKKYSVIMGKLKGEDTMTEQAYRYNIDSWTATEAKKHCKDHSGKFEAAEKCIDCEDPEDGTEDEAGDPGKGDGKSSGLTPETIQTEIEILLMEE